MPAMFHHEPTHVTADLMVDVKPTINHDAIELYRKAMEEQTSGPRPSAPPAIEAAVHRVPGRQLSDDEAMAVIEKHVAENMIPLAINMLRQLQAAVPAPPRKTVGLWVKKKSQVSADARKAAHAGAVVSLQDAIARLQSGVVPPMFRHLLPVKAPVINEGKDRFVATYHYME
jgi:hypothetical protein